MTSKVDDCHKGYTHAEFRKMLGDAVRMLQGEGGEWKRLGDELASGYAQLYEEHGRSADVLNELRHCSLEQIVKSLKVAPNVYGGITRLSEEIEDTASFPGRRPGGGHHVPILPSAAAEAIQIASTEDASPLFGPHDALRINHGAARSLQQLVRLRVRQAVERFDPMSVEPRAAWLVSGGPAKMIEAKRIHLSISDAKRFLSEGQTIIEGVLRPLADEAPVKSGTLAVMFVFNIAYGYDHPYNYFYNDGYLGFDTSGQEDLRRVIRMEFMPTRALGERLIKRVKIVVPVTDQYSTWVDLEDGQTPEDALLSLISEAKKDALDVSWKDMDATRLDYDRMRITAVEDRDGSMHDVPHIKEAKK